MCLVSPLTYSMFTRSRSLTDQQVMVVTGTSRGIGRYLAANYADQGWMVVGCARSESDFDHPNYDHTQVDITDEKQVIKWISRSAKKFGRIDALLNNAGDANLNHALLTPGKTVDRLFDINFNGTFFTSREVAKVMQRQKYGRIVNFSSVAVFLALEGEAVYAATKSAVETYSRVLARELAPLNITVNLVAPAPIKTDLIKGVPEDTIQKLLRRLVFHRYAEFDDVTNVIDFFIKPESSYITGQTITLGGWS